MYEASKIHTHTQWVCQRLASTSKSNITINKSVYRFNEQNLIQSLSKRKQIEGASTVANEEMGGDQQ